MHMLCYLISSEKDGDFKNSGEGVSRNRIIVEFAELDRAYILKDIPESSKIKHFNEIFAGLNNILDHWFGKGCKVKTTLMFYIQRAAFLSSCTVYQIVVEFL